MINNMVLKIDSVFKNSMAKWNCKEIFREKKSNTKSHFHAWNSNEMRFLVTNLKECFITVLPTYPLKKKKLPLLLTPDPNLHCAPPCIVPQVTLPTSEYDLLCTNQCNFSDQHWMVNKHSSAFVKHFLQRNSRDWTLL